MPEPTAVVADAAPAPTPTPTPAPITETLEGSAGKADAVVTPPKAAASADWRDGLAGDALEFAKRFTSPHDVVNSALDLRKANGAMIKVPGKDAKPEDVAKFNKAMGAGETVDAYQAAFPKPEGRDLSDTEKTIQGKVSEVLLKHHVPVAAAGELHTVVHEISQGLEAERERVAKQGRETNEAALRREWGGDYEANIQLASRAAKAFGGDKLLDFAAKAMVDGVKLGDHPEFLRVFGQVGRRMGEGTFIGAVTADERASVQDTITTKTRAMMAANHKGDKETANRLNQELMELQGKLHGHTPAVGLGGRHA